LILTGLVRDLLQRPVPDAKVEIADGPSAGRATMTDVRGQFAFDALPSSTTFLTLTVSKDGYVTASPRIRTQAEAIVFLRDIGLANLEDFHTITFTADASCTQLPPQLKTRSYRAVITQSTSSSAQLADPSAFVSALSGANFQEAYGAMWLTAARDAARFNVFSWDAYNWWLEDDPIIERVTPTTHLSLSGTAIGAVANGQSTISATLDGTFSYCAESKPATNVSFPLQCAVPAVDCKSAHHQLTLSP
jgi:hypothetical protein